LAVMHANNDSLGVRSASVSGSDAEGKPREDRPSSSGRVAILAYFSEVSSGATSSVKKLSPVWRSSHT
jgi:hypothetical protein